MLCSEMQNIFFHFTVFEIYPFGDIIVRSIIFGFLQHQKTALYYRFASLSLPVDVLVPFVL